MVDLSLQQPDNAFRSGNHYISAENTYIFHVFGVVCLSHGFRHVVQPLRRLTGNKVILVLARNRHKYVCVAYSCLFHNRSAGSVAPYNGNIQRVGNFPALILAAFYEHHIVAAFTKGLGEVITYPASSRDYDFIHVTPSA